jgi:nitrogen fixation-related uncharacterized protein
MKDWRNYGIILAALVALIAFFVACEKQKQYDDVSGTSNDAKLMADIAVLQSKVKQKDHESILNRKVQDSLRASNQELIKRDKSRQSIDDIKPKKSVKIDLDYKPTISDTGSYYSKQDYHDLETPCKEVQQDLKTCLTNASKLDSIIVKERGINSSKDSSQNNIMASQQDAINEKSKQVSKLSKQLKGSRLSNKVLGVVAVLLLLFGISK